MKIKLTQENQTKRIRMMSNLQCAPSENVFLLQMRKKKLAHNDLIATLQSNDTQ